MQHERLQIGNGKHLWVEEHIANGDYPLHWHSFFEIEIVRAGAGAFVINDTEYGLDTYNLFFLTPTDFHSVRVHEQLRVINLSFDESVMDERDLSFLLFSDTKRAYRLSADEYARITAAAQLLQHECEQEDNCQKQLLQYVLQCLLRKNDADVAAATSHYQGIKKAIVYMEMHFKEELSLRAIADAAGYNPTYFSELFKKITGESYMQTLTKLRLGCARTLLAAGHTVANACFLSGFGSLSHFSAVFKKHCSLSPGAYRKLHRK